MPAFLLRISWDGRKAQVTAIERSTSALGVFLTGSLGLSHLGKWEKRRKKKKDSPFSCWWIVFQRQYLTEASSRLFPIHLRASKRNERYFSSHLFLCSLFLFLPLPCFFSFLFSSPHTKSILVPTTSQRMLFYPTLKIYYYYNNFEAESPRPYYFLKKPYYS